MQMISRRVSSRLEILKWSPTSDFCATVKTVGQFPETETLSSCLSLADVEDLPNGSLAQGVNSILAGSIRREAISIGPVRRFLNQFLLISRTFGMRLPSHSFCLLPLLLSSGCALNQPLVVRDQAKIIKQESKRLKNYAEPVQDKIKTAGTVAALVVVPNDSAAPPAIYSTQDTLATALDHLSEIQAGRTCFVVFARNIPLPPEQLSCAQLALNANQLQETRIRESAQQAKLVETRTDLTALRADLTNLLGQVARLSDSLKREQEMLDQHGAAITRNNRELERHETAIARNSAQLERHETTINSNHADIASVGKVLAPTSSLVQFHEAQLKNTEKLLHTLIAQYTKSADAIGQNNQQIDSMIKDLNTSFAQVRAALDQMQQKLSTIK